MDFLQLYQLSHIKRSWSLAELSSHGFSRHVCAHCLTVLHTSISLDNHDAVIDFPYVVRPLNYRYLLDHWQASSLRFTQVVHSTNDYIFHSWMPKDTLLLAEYQTKGRGQRQRSWVAPFASSVLLSYKKTFDKTYSLDGFSVLVGQCLKQTLLRHYPSLSLYCKWPNDIYCQGKKLAGILVESTTMGEVQTVVVGVGLNVVYPVDNHPLWISLEVALGKSLRREEVALLVANSVDMSFCQLQSKG